MVTISDFIQGVQEKYPKKLLEGRITAEGNVIACIYKDPFLMDDAKLKVSNFISKDGCFYFALAQLLRNKGFECFDEVTIRSQITPKIEAAFDNRGGWKVIENMVSIINTQNWHTYADILRRENIILNLYENGFNLLSSVIDKDKTIIPIELFRTMDSDSVIEWYEYHLNKFGTGYSSKVLEDCNLDIDDQFINDCIKGVESGVPFDVAGQDINNNTINCLPYLSRQINGLEDGTTTILGAFSSAGKTTFWTTVIMGLLHRGRKVLIISNEQDIKAFKTNFLMWIIYKYFRYYHITKHKLQNGELDENDKAMLWKSQKYYREHYMNKIHFVKIVDADIELVKQKIREYVLGYGYDTVLYDTLKTDFNQLDKDNKPNVELLKESRDLDAIANKYHIIMLCSLQLALYLQGKLFLDSSTLSTSKQIKEVCENLWLMRNVYSEELDPDNKRYYCHPFQLKKIDNKWEEVPYDADLTAKWRMLFVDKNRNGENSCDTGIAYLLKFNGQYGTFQEVAQARPKHGQI